MNKNISVVIPTYNSWETLKICIESIKNQNYKPFEIIIIDNASSDRSYENLKKFFPGIKLIRLTTNTGVTGGRNRGIEGVSPKSDFILFFDHDMKADKHMLEELVMVADSQNDIGIVTPKIYYTDNKKRIWAAGTGINLWNGQVLFRGGIDLGQYEKEEEVQVAPAVFLVKRQVLEKLVKFDDRYFATYEDTDFCFRAKKIGFKTYYAPKAYAYHSIPSDPRDESLRLLSRSYFIGRNRILFMRDFGKSFFVFLIFLPIFLIYYLRLALVYNRFDQWLQLLKGTFEGLIMVFLSKKTIFVGERPSLSDIDGLHMAKYKFASNYCKEKAVLELGCGSGYGSKFLAENGAKFIQAYDINEHAITFAKKNFSHKNVNFAKGDAENLDIADKYEVVLSFEVIEHLKDGEKLIKLAKKVLKNKGLFILSTPNRAYSIMDDNKPSNPYHIYEYYPKELKQILLKYFKNIDLYGVVLKNKEKKEQENLLHNSLKWKLINMFTNKRFIRKIISFLPEYPKRLVSGESKLIFKTDDFAVIKNQQDKATDFVAVCR